jgi:glycosyltransferase involved in cell wall biosynthesis
MKLVYLTVTMPFGQREPFFIPEVQEMVRQGCQLLIVPRSPAHGVSNRDAEGLPELAVPRPLVCGEILVAAAQELLRHPLRALRALGWLFHSRDLKTCLKNLLAYPKSLWIARLARQWGADHIHAQWATVTSTMAMVASHVSGIPWSCTAHRGDIAFNNLLAMKIRRATFFRFIAQDGVATARALCGGALDGNIVVLHSVVEMPERVAFRATLSDPPLLLCVAYLHERKGHKYLFEAVRLLRERGTMVHLQLAGDGEARDMLEALVDEAGLRGQVSFLGMLGHADLLSLYRGGKVDIAVLPTLHEGIPAGLLEPMAYGIPVIATNTGGIPELLEDGAGIMVPPRDAGALADAIQRLLGDASLRRQLAETGRQRVERGWDVTTVVSTLLEHLSGNCAHQAGQRGQAPSCNDHVRCEDHIASAAKLVPLPPGEESTSSH